MAMQQKLPLLPPAQDFSFPVSRTGVIQARSAVCHTPTTLKSGKLGQLWADSGCEFRNGLPGNRPGGSVDCNQRPGAAAGNCAGEGISQKERQELLWQHLFSDPSEWWDNRVDKKSPRHPDFRHKISREPLWLDNTLKPAWVDSKLARWGVAVTEGEEGEGGEALNSEVEALRKRCEEAVLSEAVEALELLVQRGCHVSAAVLYRVLRRCLADKDLGCGRRVHALAVECGFESNAYLATQIIGMYAAHGKLEDAVQVFTKVSRPDLYVWSSIILAHARLGQPSQAVSLYKQMRAGSVKPDNRIFVAALKACAEAEDLDSGKQVHADIPASAVKEDVFVATSLVNMYAKCGSLEEARKVFDSLPRRNVVTWNAIIAGFSQQGLGGEALALYESMRRESMVVADHVTFVSLLQACASVPSLKQGRAIHLQIRGRGLEGDAVIGNSLVNMYAKCGSLVDAREVFDRLPRRDVVTWNSMIAGYTQQGLGREALALYASMQYEGVTPGDHVTFLCLVQACTSVGALQQGKEIHSQIQERGLGPDVLIGNCLVNMYTKCGSLKEAREVFDSLTRKDVVTWNSMISGYSQQGLGHEALALYASMQHEGITPANRVTFLSLLQACASAGAVQLGKQLHFEIREGGLEDDGQVGNGLVDMYAKCGSLEDAVGVFHSLPRRDVVTWTAMLNGYAVHSDGPMAVQCFEHMLQQGIVPDETTFLCLLVACSHSGLVQEGQRYFRMMVEYGILPNNYHYSCMVDLLGRSGQLDEAENMLENKSVVNDSVAWTALLSACKGYGDLERGRRCFDRLVALDPTDASPYVLLGTIYASAGRWDDADRVESLRKAAGALKKPAKACIEVDRKVHEFTVGEERADISATLRTVNMRLKDEGGHVPQTELVLKPVSEQKKEDALCGHAEKLALAYGLLNTPDGTTLLVTKNLRMCNDCHSSTKVMSRLEKREIVVRDGHRVHRFLDGSCSCGDRH